ncbi:hypothetical protein RP726_02800 [Candidatus Methylospira mobilis]|uniref:hypothetical protein n=1 Tax=Candidatus Methylospira mobilis TaxID=1808979 RepID=UPI0028E1D0B9|nr:hypothetical protein [Candidatus Methylospira mobilis]WNV05350.1 hypothetical protein RP726_02800 [Candidatus Methylospira mobilis]
MIKLNDGFLRYPNIFIAVGLIAGITLTFAGLSSLAWPQSIPWEGAGPLGGFLGFLAFTAIAISLIARKFGLNASQSTVAVLLLLSIVIGAGALWPLLVALWFAVACTILGYWLLEKLKIKTSVWHNCFLVGAGIYGASVGLIAYFPVNYSGIYAAALALPVALAWRPIVEKGVALLESVNHGNTNERPGFGVNYLEAAIGVLAVVYFVVALKPEVGFDALVTHLFVPAHMSLRHRWTFDVTTYVWAVAPMLGDWIFTIGYMLGGEAAARLINVGFIFVLGRLVLDCVLWAGGSAVGARWAVLVFLSTPLTYMVGNSLFIDSIWASFVVAGTLAMLRTCFSSAIAENELPISGFLLGCGLAVKAVTFTVLPGLLLLLAWRFQSWRKTAGLRSFALGFGFFSAIGGIPYATAWWLTGNPVFPLFNKVFKSAYSVTTENFSDQRWGRGFTWDFPYRITFETGKYLEAYTGGSGFQWLLLFIPSAIALIVFKKTRGVALLLIGAVAIVVVFCWVGYLRYALPSWAILTAVTGVGLSAVITSRSFLSRIYLAAAVLTVALNLLFFAGPSAREFTLKPVFDQFGKEEYLRARLPVRSAVELVNRLNPDRNPVAVFAQPLMAGLSADALYLNWYNITFRSEINSKSDEKGIADVLMKRGVNFIILDAGGNGEVCCGAWAEKQALIEKISDKIAAFGAVSVRKLKTEYLFKTELLINAGLESIEGWSVPEGAKYNPETDIIQTNVDFPATQNVSVYSGRYYLNTVVARCAEEPTSGRVQITWLDAKRQFVRADIKPFDCIGTEWAEHTMEVMAPLDAVYAIVYISGHTQIPLEFKRNSLRQ